MAADRLEPPGAFGLPGLVPPSHFQPRSAAARSLPPPGAEPEAERRRSQGLEAELEVERRRSQSLGAELEAERRRSQGLRAELEAEKGRSQSLEAELEAERRRSQGLEAELEAEQRRSQHLGAELDAERRRSHGLEAELAAQGRGLGLGAELEAEKGRGLALGAELAAERRRSLAEATALGAELEEESEEGRVLLAARVAALSRILVLQELELSREALPGAPPGPPRALLGCWRRQVFALLLRLRAQELRHRRQVASLELGLREGEASAELLRCRAGRLAVALAQAGVAEAGQRRRAEVAEEALGDLLAATRRLGRALAGREDELVAATRRLDGFGHRLERAAQRLRRLPGRVALARLRWPPAGDCPAVAPQRAAVTEVTRGASTGDEPAARHSPVALAQVTPEVTLEVTQDKVTRDKVTRDKVTWDKVAPEEVTRPWVPLGPRLLAPPRGDELPPPDRGRGAGDAGAGAAGAGCRHPGGRRRPRPPLTPPPPGPPRGPGVRVLQRFPARRQRVTKKAIKKEQKPRESDPKWGHQLPRRPHCHRRHRCPQVPVATASPVPPMSPMSLASAAGWWHRCPPMSPASLVAWWHRCPHWCWHCQCPGVPNVPIVAGIAGGTGILVALMSPLVLAWLVSPPSWWHRCPHCPWHCQWPGVTIIWWHRCSRWRCWCHWCPHCPWHCWCHRHPGGTDVPIGAGIAGGTSVLVSLVSPMSPMSLALPVSWCPQCPHWHCWCHHHPGGTDVPIGAGITGGTDIAGMVVSPVSPIVPSIAGGLVALVCCHLCPGIQVSPVARCHQRPGVTVIPAVTSTWCH